ncbi:SCO3374 family protein [Streptomyces sp. NPDC054904]|uniref:SCO3374 family protein n=1 Tax=unclassified Streptomyces TaxID=2593676 RepID=UPI002481D8E4|nr:SCO3374 family protein [Streptomyces sp. Isolate_45]MDA5286633.1 SCO3374 family protein [Streptomyces sp. Isolate_45]
MAVSSASSISSVGVPPPRVPAERDASCAPWSQWYERVLGWQLAVGSPAQLVTGVRFDVLELPADAGAEVLRRPVPTGPVALVGRRMRFLVAPGSADELEGLLDWLEWGGVPLDLTAVGTGGRIAAPVPPGWPQSPRGAAVWLRPPELGCEASLPSLPAPGQGTGSGRSSGPGLVRLVAAAATECHRARLWRRTPQPLAS